MPATEPIRAVLLGTSGAGKSTFARRLAAMRGCAFIELDALHWLPGWQQVPAEQFRDALGERIAADAWVADGNYRFAWDVLWPCATHLIWLDYSRSRVMWRVFVRTLRRWARREVICNGNRESLRMSFFSRDSILWWSWSTFARRRAEYQAVFADPPYPHLVVVRVGHPAEAEALLQALGGADVSVDPAA